MEAALDRITANPGQFPSVLQDIRRARLQKFPYGLFFRIEHNALIIIACFHASRDPKPWQRRI